MCIEGIWWNVFEIPSYGKEARGELKNLNEILFRTGKGPQKVRRERCEGKKITQKILTKLAIAAPN